MIHDVRLGKGLIGAVVATDDLGDFVLTRRL